jgi:CheY-like chemotaxis protein
MQFTQQKRLRLVLVENDDDDVFFIERALQKSGLQPSVTRLSDGQDAIDYFSENRDGNRPDWVMLDVQMPRKNGFEVLRWLRSHPLYQRLRVMILTSSDDPRDVSEAKHLGADEFVTKENSCAKVIEVLKRNLET